MRAFEVHVNGKRLCVAGIDGEGVLDALIVHAVGTGRRELDLTVGGLISKTDEHVLWGRRRLKIGDEVRVKIVEEAAVDRPKERQRRDPKQELAVQKRYVRQMARKLGWAVSVKRPPK